MKRNISSIVLLYLCSTNYAWGMDHNPWERLKQACLNDEYQAVRELLVVEAKSNVKHASDKINDLLFHVKTPRIAVLLEHNGICLDKENKEETSSILCNACFATWSPMLLQYYIRRYCRELQVLDVKAPGFNEGTLLHDWAYFSLIQDTRPHTKYLIHALEKMDVLFEAGVDPALRDKHNDTPLDVLKSQQDFYSEFNDMQQVYDILIASYEAKLAMHTLNPLEKMCAKEEEKISAIQEKRRIYEEILTKTKKEAEALVQRVALEAKQG